MDPSESVDGIPDIHPMKMAFILTIGLAEIQRYRQIHPATSKIHVRVKRYLGVAHICVPVIHQCVFQVVWCHHQSSISAHNSADHKYCFWTCRHQLAII
jgi:hypothetical protein